LKWLRDGANLNSTFLQYISTFLKPKEMRLIILVVVLQPSEKPCVVWLSKWF